MGPMTTRPPLPLPVQEEAAHLDLVRGHLLEHPLAPDGPSTRPYVTQLSDLLHEVGGAKGEDLPSIFHQYEHLSFLVEQLAATPTSQPPDPDSPYFGHMRLQDEKGRGRDLYIGRGTRVEGTVCIVDWRNAPVSGIFYRYEEGDEFEEELGGVELAGKVTLRRTVGISQGQLQRVDAPQGTWVREGEDWIELEERARLLGGSGQALRSPTTSGARRGEARLGTGRQLRADKHLPAIAALIDPHQFNLITRPTSGLVLVRGGAGSGKTTVALHRVAWLAYAEPQRFRPERMMVLTFGRGLARFISHVLPGLGVRGVPVHTWSAWSEQARIRHFPQLARQYRTDSHSALVRLKAHPLLPALLQERVAARKAPARGREALDDFVSFLADGERVTQEIRRRAPGSLPEAVLTQAARLMEDQATALRAALAHERDSHPALDVEDDALLLRLWQLRVGPLRGTSNLAHLVVDEVQDFSTTELLVLLGCLDRHRSVTFAGDLAQQLSEAATTWDTLLSLPGLGGTVVETLQVSYRSTRQIMEFARSLLGPLADSDAPLRTRKEGPPVQVFSFSDAGAVVAFLSEALQALGREEPLASVCLIAADGSTADLYYRGLLRADVPRLRRVRDQDFLFSPGIEVAEVADVKGLEFDYVVVLDASARAWPDTDSSRRSLHVAATRAIHQLWVTVVGAAAAAVRPFQETP